MKNFVLIILLILNFNTLLSSISKAEVSNISDNQDASKFLAFNWGSSMGVDLALTSAESDSIQTEKGYLIGPVFWKSLMISQSDADHKAGDGVYFSTHPLNSSRFGPSLLLLEIEIENINDKSLFDVLNENQARAHPKDLPTIVKYQGNWHVIKSLPRNDKVKIWIRKPTLKDVERIYHSNELNSDITKVFSLIIGISHRYSYRFKKFESKEQIPKEYRSNKSTDLFIDGLIDKLINEGLSTSRINLENLEEYNKFKNALSSTLYNLKQIKDQEKVFKLNMTKIIYKKLLERDQVWPEDILNIFKNYNDEYFEKYHLKFNKSLMISCKKLF